MTAERMPIALGDLHGRLDLLDAALAAFPDRSFVLLGDYIDRGPDSAGVIGRVRDLVEMGRAVALLGNHDQWMIDSLVHGRDPGAWQLYGGLETMRSYSQDWAVMREDALWMHEHLHPWFVQGQVLFAHAMRPCEQQPDVHLWGRPNGPTGFAALPAGITSSIHGHTP